MEEMVKFCWKILGSLLLICSGILRVLGELIRIIGVGLCFIGGFWVGTSSYLYDKASDWLKKEPGFEVETEEVTPYDPYCVTED